jgi:hypothetical protein
VLPFLQLSLPSRLHTPEPGGREGNSGDLCWNLSDRDEDFGYLYDHRNRDGLQRTYTGYMLNISESPSDTLAPTDVAMVISVPVIYGFSPVIFPVKINACDTGLQHAVSSKRCRAEIEHHTLMGGLESREILSVAALVD